MEQKRGGFAARRSESPPLKNNAMNMGDAYRRATSGRCGRDLEAAAAIENLAVSPLDRNPVPGPQAATMRSPTPMWRRLVGGAGKVPRSGNNAANAYDVTTFRFTVGRRQSAGQQPVAAGDEWQQKLDPRSAAPPVPPPHWATNKCDNAYKAFICWGFRGA